MICKDLQASLETLTHRYDREQIAVLLDSNIAFDSPYPTLRIETEEAHKSLETVTQIWDFLLEHHITRRGLLLCVGGGVLTDMGGFAAATYKRGIDFIHIPTTLLAMIDASSGGKTGINYRGLKNHIGVFASPVETLIWPGWLRTLPPHQFLSGFAEMLKTGFLSPTLWNSLLQYDLETMDLDALAPLIEECLRVKEQIVQTDPREAGLRKVLNLGHTFGHALEEITMVNRQSSNGQLLHGYAVLYGLIAELYLSVALLGCPKEPLQQLTQLMLHHYGRPECKCSDRAQLIALMQQDKKNERAAQINCTLIRDIGDPVINHCITPEQAEEALEYLFSL